jgi:hypothetical protein
MLLGRPCHLNSKLQVSVCLIRANGDGIRYLAVIISASSMLVFRDALRLQRISN